MATVKLPKDKKAIAKLVERMHSEGEKLRNVHRVGWAVVDNYMKGARRFSMPDYSAGTLHVRYGANRSDGRLPFRFEAPMVKFAAQHGRLLAIDAYPVCQQRGLSLDGLRKSAMGQVALDYVVAKQEIGRIKNAFLINLLKFGTAGLGVWGTQDPKNGQVVPTFEVIPPWELMAIPADAPDVLSSMGLIRDRWVPLSWLKEQTSGMKLRGWSEVRTVESPYGEEPADAGIDGGASSSDAGSTREHDRQDGPGNKNESTKYTHLVELWLKSPLGTVSEYVMVVGGKCMHHINYTAEGMAEPLMPIFVAQYLTGGGFYGRSFMGLLLPLGLAAERMIKNVFRNMEELDVFGMLFLPSNMGIDVNGLKATKRPRMSWYDPDPMAPELRPFSLSPTNTGLMPAKAVSSAVDLLDYTSQQPPALTGNAPGRVDSATALSELWETGTIPLAGPISDIAAAFGHAYNVALELIRMKWGREETLRVATIDNALAGIVMNTETHEVSLDANQLPEPEDVLISIRSANPKSRSVRKAELLEMLDKQIITPMEFRIVNRKEGLGFPVGNEAEYSGYEKAILNNILLFRDGEEPGEAIFSPAADNPAVHLYALDAFMASPAFALASVEVREAFEDHKKNLQIAAGGYPEDLAYGEDMAEPIPPMGGMGGGTPGMPGMGGMGGGIPEGLNQMMGGMPPQQPQQPQQPPNLEGEALAAEAPAQEELE